MIMEAGRVGHQAGEPGRANVAVEVQRLHADWIPSSSLFRPSPDLTRPIHIMEGNLL